MKINHLHWLENNKSLVRKIDQLLLGLMPMSFTRPFFLISDKKKTPMKSKISAAKKIILRSINVFFTGEKYILKNPFTFILHWRKKKLV